MKRVFLFLLVGTLCVASCTKENASMPDENYSFQFKGVVKKTGVTSYMYGTHTISTESQTYALRSSTVNLDTYVSQSVTIKGTKITGYPVDNGPEFIEVKAVE